MSMPSLKEAPPEEVARRMREIAEGLADPSDAAVARRYAVELETVAARERRTFWKPRA